MLSRQGIHCTGLSPLAAFLVPEMSEKEDTQFWFIRTKIAGLCNLFYYNPRRSVLMYYFAMQTVYLNQIATGTT